ncbi:MAG: 3'-5' exonuclease, partial [Actinomycetes bacterium]
FEEVFIRVGLPYKVVGGVRFYERREVRDALAYLRLLANPEDTVSLRRIINVPKRGIGDRAEACLEALAQRENLSYAQALRRCEDAYGLATRSLAAVQAFRQLVDDLRTLVEAGTGPATVLEAVLERTGYAGELAGSADPQDQTRLENLQELVSVAREFEESSAATGGAGTLTEFLEQVALVADSDEIPDEPEEGAEADGDAPGGVVTLMTLHTAKGLEFPVVFLTGLEDGVFPHQRSLADPSELEEERRLAYVGVTRAQQRLYLSRSVVRSAWGTPQHYPASRFLQEVPGELVDWRREESSVANVPAIAAVAARSSARSPGNRVVIHLQPGDRVTHDTFGMGTVVTVEGVGERAVASIDFRSEGVKRLLLRYAPVEKL